MKKFNRKGFTMVELLIVLAIIAILAAVAIPVYSSQLESSRKKVDESNLRAATGLAAQDYMLSLNIDHLNNVNGQDFRRYIVLGYKGDTDAKNMMVYPGNVWVMNDGTYTWIDPQNNPNVAFKISNFASNGNNNNNAWQGDYGVLEHIKNGGTPMINGKEVVLYPLQQKGGKAKFDIEITKGGVVKTSQIVDGNLRLK